MAPIAPGASVSVDVHEVEAFANRLDEALAAHLPEERRRLLLQLPQQYYDATSRKLAKLQTRPSRNGTDDLDMDLDETEANRNVGDVAEVERLRKEAETWDLFRRLLPLRFSDDQSQTTSFDPIRGSDDLVADFFESDPLAKERRVVLQWLQNTASSGPDIDDLTHDLLEQAGRGQVTAHGWLHTRSAIKLRKNVTAWPHLLDKQSSTIETTHVTSDGAALVTQLDPDATSRQGRKLERQDEFCERASWLGCFEHLRRGSDVSAIREWCSDRTELWKAISMSALLPANEGNEANVNDHPTSLALWRRMCFGLARQGGTDDYERAVYGVLSGDIQSVEKVARNWDDLLFAHYNALLRTQMDTFILSRCPPDAAANITQSFPSFDAVQFHGNATSVEQRLQTLDFQKDFAEQARDPYKALQTAFIGKSLENHLSAQGRLLEEQSNGGTAASGALQLNRGSSEVERQKLFGADQSHGLKVTTHVFVLITLLQQLERERHTEKSQMEPAPLIHGGIIGAYADFLRGAEMMELIPLYCSILEVDQCHKILSRNLIQLDDSKRRAGLLRLMEKTGIDIHRFVISQTDFWYAQLDRALPIAQLLDRLTILEDVPEDMPQAKQVKADFFGDDDDDLEERDEDVIRSLEWLLQVNSTWPYVFRMGIKAYKMFFGKMHLNAARRLMNTVNFASVTQVMGELDMDGDWFDDIGFWQQQLEQDAITDFTAREVDAEARTFRELEALAKALDSLETLASMRELGKEMPATNREFWTRLSQEVKAVRENMEPLLGKWLWVGIEGNDEELVNLRRVYLPETVLAYVSALHYVGTAISREHLLEALELAARVAERDSFLCQVFVETGRMRELVEAFAACSKSLAISPGEKHKSAGKSKGKSKDMGWSREIWSVKAKPVEN